MNPPPDLPRPVVVSVGGDIDFASVAAVRAEIELTLLTLDGGELILDFAETLSLDSAGLSLLVSVRELCIDRSVHLALRHVSPALRHLLRIVDLEKQFSFVEAGPQAGNDSAGAHRGFTATSGLSRALPAATMLRAEPDANFDKLAALARKVLGVPTALVSLVDADQQVFPGAVGLPEPWQERRSTPLSHSFCQYVVSGAAPLIVADSREDQRLKDNPAIVDLGVIAYAGVPIVDLHGRAVGSLCAIADRPREWSQADVSTLSALAAACSAELQLRTVIGRAAAAAERERVSQHLQREVLSQLLAVVVLVSSASSLGVHEAAGLLAEILEALDAVITGIRSTMSELEVAQESEHA